MVQLRRYTKWVYKGSLLVFTLLVMAAFQNCSGGFKTTHLAQQLSPNPQGEHSENENSESEEFESEPLENSAKTLAHGKDLTAAMVGPAAIGITPSISSGAVGISNAGSASYIKQINQSATYDGFTVNGAHLLIEGVNFTGTVDINSAQPVVIRGCKVRANGYWSVYVRSGGPVYLLYSDVGGLSPTSGADVVVATGNNGGNVFFRNHIIHGSDGMSLGSKNDQILENLINQFSFKDGDHHDGIQAAGGNTGVRIARNKILLNSSETGTINLGSWTSPAQEVTIDSNYLAGGGYVFYGDGTAGTHDITVTNNIFGTDFFPDGGHWGPVAYWLGNAAGMVWTNNTLSTGKVVTP